MKTCWNVIALMYNLILKEHDKLSLLGYVFIDYREGTDWNNQTRRQKFARQR
ncbi:hypothetical protein Hanom_Chr07g00635911 [Helianthus anomalus]